MLKFRALAQIAILRLGFVSQSEKAVVYVVHGGGKYQTKVPRRLLLPHGFCGAEAVPSTVRNIYMNIGQDSTTTESRRDQVFSSSLNPNLPGRLRIVFRLPQ